jgi:hypothetical protein
MDRRPPAAEDPRMPHLRHLLSCCCLLLATACATAETAATASAGSAGDGWFDAHTGGGSGPSAISMADWLDAPAGRHGGVRISGDHLAFADGSPAVLWGLNNCNQGCAPAKEVADRRAAWYAEHGVNAVRQHKFMQTICEDQDATRITAANQDLFDYNFAALKSHGIYSGWSPIYYLKIKPGNRSQVLAAAELEASCDSQTDGLVNFAPDLQALHIDLLVHLLTTVNRYTKLRYADDPALAYLEIQNEDCIFWWSLEKKIKSCPTYKQVLCKRFCAWLRKRYGDQAHLIAAWGPTALDAYKDWQQGESLDQDTIVAACNPWWVGPDGMKIAAQMGVTRRNLDTFAFMADCQDDYYAKAAAAIRATGFKGPIIGSPWQAADGLSHYWNIRCDQAVGMVDRHNYFGGGTANGWQFDPCTFDDGAMLAHPGSGLLSSGLQLVAGRPFSLSEWDTQLPDEWLAEGAPLIAAYGIGLQGWSMAYQFASDGDSFSDCIDRRQSWGGSTLWNTDTPLKIGLYPALARMIQRGDVVRAKPIAVRTITDQQLCDGTLPFAERVASQGDVKTITGAVPPEALAVGRVELRFADHPAPAPTVDLAPYTSGTILTSTTRQLAWDTAGGGVVTIDTPCTKAVVGFAPGRAFTLGAATITIDNPFAVVLITSLDRRRDIASAKSLLITAVARQRNTGMRVEGGTKLVDIGHAPMQLEGVRAAIRLARAGTPRVTALDLDGRRTTRTLAVEQGAVRIDGAADAAIYWLVEYPAP